MKLADITKIIEGVLFVAGEGVDRDEFKRVYDLSDKEINKCLDTLREKYNKDSGVNVITYKNKIQLCSNPDLADSIAEILNPIRERSLTKSALETIAIVAYKQPITRTEIEQIRGVNCDYAVQLLQKNNLIEVVGRKDAVGKPLLFGTTDEFLKRFELDSLEALPNYKELLDRIRVIHSEGDSLYREFTIPEDDETEGEAGESAIADESAIEENVASTEQSGENPNKKNKANKTETNAVQSNNLDEAQANEDINAEQKIATKQEEILDEKTEEKPKKSSNKAKEIKKVLSEEENPEKVLNDIEKAEKVQGKAENIEENSNQADAKKSLKEVKRTEKVLKEDNSTSEKEGENKHSFKSDVSEPLTDAKPVSSQILETKTSKPKKAEKNKIRSIEEIVSETSNLFEDDDDDARFEKKVKNPEIKENTSRGGLSNIVSENTQQAKAEETTEQTPKLSWKDKIRARLAQNAQNAQNGEN